MWFRSQRKRTSEFLKSRAMQPASVFVTECGLSEELADAGLAVRDAIANLGGVDAGYVHAKDLFQTDLVHFDFWGSLDTVAVILELENALGVRISDEQAQQIPHPEMVDGLTVADFVNAVLDRLRFELLGEPDRGR